MRMPAPLPAPESGEARIAKGRLRDRVRAHRAARSAEQRAADDHARCALLLDYLAATRATCVAAYAARDDEPSLAELIAVLIDRGVRVLLPVLGPFADGQPRRSPDWAVFEGDARLRPGLWGIPEPTSQPLGAAGLSQAAVVLCAGLAAGLDGTRLGFGGGWYDRALRHRAADARAIVVVNADEMFDTLPREEHDVGIDAIATERGLSWVPAEQGNSSAGTER